MIHKIVSFFKVKDIDLLVYKVNSTTGETIDFDPYQIRTEIKTWRKKIYKVENGNDLVHTSCLYTNSGTLMALKIKGLLIGDCYTNPAYRGQSVYPKMLRFIAEENNGNTVCVFVSPSNTASIAGIEKSGAKKWCAFKAKKMMLFFWNKKIEVY